MKRKFLEDLGLEKDVIDKIMAENGKDVESAKGELEAITSERDKLKNDLSERDTQIDSLKKSAGSNEELKAQIEKLQADNKASKVSNAVELALISAKAKNIKSVKALLTDLDNADFNDDGTIKGLSKQIEKLKTRDDTKFLFESDDKPKNKISGVTPADPGDNKPQGITKSVLRYPGQIARYALNIYCLSLYYIMH